MIRLALLVTVIAGGFYLATFYKLGDKPLAGHLSDIYRSPVVQEKLRDLSSGVDKRVHHIEHEAEKALPKKNEPRVDHRRQSAQLDDPRPALAERRAPEREHPSPAVSVPENPALHAERPQPAHDQLTDDDRSSLDHLLAKKLAK